MSVLYGTMLYSSVCCRSRTSSSHGRVCHVPSGAMEKVPGRWPTCREGFTHWCPQGSTNYPGAAPIVEEMSFQSTLNSGVIKDGPKLCCKSRLVLFYWFWNSGQKFNLSISTQECSQRGSASCPWSVCKAANKGEGGTPPKAPSELCRSHRWGTAFMFSCLAPLTWGHHRGYGHLIFLSVLPSQLQLQMYLLNPLPPAIGPSRLQSPVEADSRRSHQKTFPGQEEV